MRITKPVVTIFETYGSGASTVGPAVASELGVPFVPQHYSSEDLESADVEPKPEERLLTRILSTLGRTAASADGGWYSGALIELDAEDAIRNLRAAAAEGCVVVGRNATVILADLPTALHVKLDGPLDHRVARGAAESGIDQAHARSRQAREDPTRSEMSRRLFNWDPRQDERFDLVLNTGTLALDLAVDMIVAAYRLKAAYGIAASADQP